MDILVSLICLAGLVGLIVGVIAILRPMPKLRLSTRGRAGLLVGASLVVLAVGGSLVSPDAKKQPEGKLASNGGGAKPKQPTYVIGQPLDVGGFRVIIRDVVERNAVGRSVVEEQASAGGVLVVVEYTVENISDRPAASYQLPHPSLIDPNGVVYERDLGKTAAYASEGKFDSKVVSDLNPGIQVKNALVFEVARASFDRKAWMVGLGSGNRLKVDIRPDAYPDVPHRESGGDCNTLDNTGDRELCKNPDLLRRSEIVVARVGRHAKLYPDDKMPEFRAALGTLFECADRACLVSRIEQIETLTSGWPLS
jgi:hypothetical protein